jgi:CRP/FNR family transcriptional regulator, cyclic AMP receptor protein
MSKSKQSVHLGVASSRSGSNSGSHAVSKPDVGVRSQQPLVFREPHFAPASLAVLGDFTGRTFYSRGSLLFTEGEPATGIFLVEKGCVKLTMCSARGKALLLGFFGPQTVLGLPAAILGFPHAATAEIVRPLTASFLAREVLLQHLRHAGDAGLRAAELVSQMLFSTLHEMETFWLSDSAEQKLARFLLSFCPPRNGRGVAWRIALGLTHEEIAQRIGVSRETVTRLLSHFKKRRILDLSRLTLTVLAPGNLEALADLSHEVNPVGLEPSLASRHPM